MCANILNSKTKIFVDKILQDNKQSNFIKHLSDGTYDIDAFIIAKKSSILNIHLHKDTLKE